MKTKLKLNWNLRTSEERSNFLKSYLPTLNFTLTNEEKELLGSYLLWGKDPSTDLNAEDEGLVTLPSSFSKWKKEEPESLEGLLETPGFSENSLLPLSEPRTLVRRKVFNREEALSKAPAHLLPQLNSLFHSIDLLDLTLTYYRILHSSQTSEPRSDLLARLSPSEIDQCLARASSLTHSQEIKLHHLLISYREDQYALSDLYSDPPHYTSSSTTSISSPLDLSLEEVEPLFLLTPSTSLFFQPEEKLLPTTFSDSDLSYLSSLLWKSRDPSKIYFSFSNPDHLAALVSTYHSLPSTYSSLLSTFDYYVSFSNLSPLHSELLSLKLSQIPNSQIRSILHSHYSHLYATPYISTIYRTQILRSIAAAATRHHLILSNLFFPENFQTCRKCGRTFFLDSLHFPSRSARKSGFSSTCRDCTKSTKEATSNGTNN